MIFGKKKLSDEERRKKQVNYFAWRPFRLQNDKWVYMQWFWREGWSAGGLGGYRNYLTRSGD